MSQTELQTKETFHLINEPANALHEALNGLTRRKPTLSYAPDYKIVYRSDLEDFRQNNVTTIGFSGGGHEPMFAGFVGSAFLSAYVSGNIFASPTSAQIFQAIKMCQPNPETSPGTLIVCGNYTGDILNAGLAVTRAEAAGYTVKFVPVGDDVAVGRQKGGKVGRRGLSGHLIALKCACGIADQGGSLDQVADVMSYVAGEVGTIGVAFDRVSLPTSTVSSLPLLPPDTIELGMGAHGEPGLQQISPPPPVEELVSRMIDLLTTTRESDPDRGFIPFSASKFPLPAERVPGRDNVVALLINSLGGPGDAILSSFAELSIKELGARGFVVERVVLGPMVTSLKMSGIGITLWRLPVDKSDEASVEIRGSGSTMSREQALALWDRKVDVVSWRQ